jgi:hypothetical protein
MSRENVERLRRNYEALNQALATGQDLAPLMDDIDPDIVIEMGVLEGTYRGPAGLMRLVEGQAAIIDGLRAQPHEFIEAGNRIVVPFRLSGKARNTGIPVEYEYVHVWTLRAGKAVHLQLYGSKAKALEAVGLRE